MKSFRFTLQWPAEGEARLRAGRFLSRHGKNKSKVVILAINAWLDAHPEQEEPGAEKKPLSILTERDIMTILERYLNDIRRDDATDSAESTVPARAAPGELAELLQGLEMFE